jgi:hypothetical protein
MQYFFGEAALFHLVRRSPLYDCDTIFTIVGTSFLLSLFFENMSIDCSLPWYQLFPVKDFGWKLNQTVSGEGL